MKYKRELAYHNNIKFKRLLKMISLFFKDKIKIQNGFNHKIAFFAIIIFNDYTKIELYIFSIYQI